MRTLKIYYAVRFEPKVLATVTSQSLPDLEELICLLIEKKFTRINRNGFRPIGRGRRHWELKVQPDDVRAALLTLATWLSRHQAARRGRRAVVFFRPADQ